MVRVVHVIASLEVGGAEVQLAQVVERADRGRFEQVVIALRPAGPLSDRLRTAGIELHEVDMAHLAGTARGLVRLCRLLRRLEPDVVQTWMYNADLIGGVATRAMGRRRLIWSVHASELDPAQMTTKQRIVLALTRRLSWLPARILVVSEEAAVVHRELGYDGAKMRVVSNGIDIDRFVPDTEAGAWLRRLVGADTDLLVGCAARFDPQKDHATLAHAFAMVLRRVPRARLVLCGRGTDAGNETLVGLLGDAGVLDRTALLGLRDDMPRVTAGFDLSVLASAYGESWSLSTGEAMACGVPCVVTDTGKPAWLVGDTGRSVPIRDAPALAQALVEMLEMDEVERVALGDRARQRIVAEGSLAASVRAYQDLWDDVMAT